MRIFNPILMGIAFVGLIGCESMLSDDVVTRTTRRITYNGGNYIIKIVEDRTSMGIAAYREDLYVCENGRWRLVKYQAEKNISLIRKYGKTTVTNAGPLVPKSCNPPPKQPKKDKTKVHTGNTIAPEITGTDGFEGGD